MRVQFHSEMTAHSIGRKTAGGQCQPFPNQDEVQIGRDGGLMSKHFRILPILGVFLLQSEIYYM